MHTASSWYQAPRWLQASVSVLTILAMAVFTVSPLLAAPATAFADNDHEHDHKVVICHGTSSEQNPWNVIEIDHDALNAHLGDGDFEYHGEDEDGHHDDNWCHDHIPSTATVIATKIVCDNESDLPNYGTGGPNITSTTASDFLAAHTDCHPVAGWQFQWAPNGTANPGDNLTSPAGAPWTTSALTDANGQVAMTIPATSDSKKTWFREVLQNGYIPFTYNLDHAHPNSNANPVSAEMYCGSDVLNYDNFEWIQGAEGHHTYNCVAWNVQKKGTLTIVKNTVGGDGKFTFNVTGQDPVTVSTEDNSGSEELTLPVGGYDVTENVPEGWTLSNVSCKYDNESVGSPVTTGEHIVIEDQGDNVTCTFTNTIIPQCNANASHTIVSSPTNTLHNGNNTVAVDIDPLTDGNQLHDAWTANVPGATWVWSSNPPSDTAGEISEDYTQNFTIVGAPQGDATLVIAADNNYSVDVNGHLVCYDTSGDNFASADTCTIPQADLHTGSNVVTFHVTNLAQENGTPQSNPAGLMYSITYGANECTQAATCDANINLLQNPSFEANVVADNGWDIFPSGDSLLKWTVAWLGAPVDGRPTTANAEIQRNSLLGITATDGSQWTELDSDYRTGEDNHLAGGPASVSLSQDIATIPGQTYNVSYDFQARPGVDTTESKINASVNNVVADTADGTVLPSGWNHRTFSFVATGASTNIAFADAGTPSDSLGPMLDNTSVTCQPAEQSCPEGQHFNNDHVCVPNVTTPSSDLSVTKTVQNGESNVEGGAVNVADQLAYLITVHNAGPDAAANVTVSDLLPSGVTWVSDNGGSSYDHTSGVWTITSIPSGSDATLSIVVTVNSGTEGQKITNSASVTHSDSTDSITDNNADDAWVTVNGGSTPPPSTPPPSGGGPIQNFGGGGGGGGIILGASTNGQVLGASCGLALNQHLRKGSPKNNKDQVMILQGLLNKYVGSNLPQSGIFGALTEAAVKAFQKKYGDDVLKPWGLSAPTGLVYFSTLWKLDMLECPDATGALPNPLIPWSQNPNAQ